VIFELFNFPLFIIKWKVIILGTLLLVFFADENDILKTKFRRVQNEIASRVNAASSIDFLYQEEVITDYDVSILIHVTDRQKQCHILLNILQRSEHPEAFIKLYDAIAKQKPYEHVIELIETTTVPQALYKRPTENELGANKRMCVRGTTNKGRLLNVCQDCCHIIIIYLPNL